MDLNIYVVHVKTLAHRKVTCEKLKSLFENHPNVTFEYITDNDPVDIKTENIRKYINYEPLKEEELKPYNSLLKNLHLNNLSNNLKHYQALEKAASSNKLSLILEDDVIFNDSVPQQLQTAIQNMPQNVDMLFLGLPAMKETSESFQNVTETFPVIPCCDSYLITPTCARKLYDAYLPIKFATNIQLSVLFRKLALNVMSLIPNIFVDGTKFGLYYSTLEVNNRLIFNQEYVKLAKLINEKNTFDEEEIQTINKLFVEVKLKTNPEFYYLKALFETKIGNVEFAKYIYQYTLYLYESNGSVINSQSHFLKDYLRIFKHLQTLPSSV
jgi:GR25 family glycosyltransferase involved in LPS biosynthesis